MTKPTLFALATLLTLSAMSSCRKFSDFIHDHPDAHDSLCRITQLNFGGLQIGVAYNAKGNPISLTELNPDKRWFTSEHFFRYDKYDRLSDYQYTVLVGDGPGDTSDFRSPFVWHKYGYPHPGIISDTVITYPTTQLHDPAPIAPPGTNIALYKFNAEGKMIATAGTVNLPNQPPPLFSSIFYDARGNGDISSYPDLVFDNTVNVYRTNKVFQLVFRDYSRNNPILKSSPPTPANQFGLPTRLPYTFSNGGLVPNFLIYSSNNNPAFYDIIYACAVPKGPIDY